MAEVQQGPLEVPRGAVMEAPARAEVEAVERIHQIRWGPVVAGVIVGLMTFMVLLALGTGFGLAAAPPTASAWWSAIAALVSLFLGGYIAGLFTGAADVATCITQGAIVWALTLCSFLIVGISFSLLGAAAARVALPEISQTIVSWITDPQAAWWFVIGNVLAFAAAALGASLGAGAAARLPVVTRRAAV